MAMILSFGLGMLAGVIAVAIIINLTILKQDRWK